MLPNEFEVLRFIAENGSNLKYGIEKVLSKPSRGRSLSHGTIYNSVDSLFKQGYIDITKECKARGHIQKTYGITLLGLCILYAEHQQEINIHKILRHWNSLSIILRKWDYLSAKMGNNFKLMIDAITKSVQTNLYRLSYIDDNYIIRTFIRVIQSLWPEEIIPWIQALRDDKELLQICIKAFTDRLESTRKSIQRQEKLLTMVQSKEKPNWEQELLEMNQLDALVLPTDLLS